MGLSHDSNVGSRNVRGRMKRGVAAALALCMMLLAVGCGPKAKAPASEGAGKSGASEKAAAGSSGGAKRAGTDKAASKASAKSAEKSKTAEKPEKPAPKPVAAVSGGGQIRLVDRGCVSFEPHWTTIRLGQSLTWHSDLKKAVTVHVSPGVFQRDEFVVPAKGTARTGPAQDAGDFSIWSLPAACQAAPHGVQGAGPGVTVEER